MQKQHPLHDIIPALLPDTLSEVRPVSEQLTDSDIDDIKGLEPTRYGDWEKNGRCIDF